MPGGSICIIMRIFMVRSLTLGRDSADWWFHGDTNTHHNPTSRLLPNSAQSGQNPAVQVKICPYSFETLEWNKGSLKYLKCEYLTSGTMGWIQSVFYCSMMCDQLRAICGSESRSARWKRRCGDWHQGMDIRRKLEPGTHFRLQTSHHNTITQGRSHKHKDWGMESWQLLPNMFL